MKQCVDKKATEDTDLRILVGFLRGTSAVVVILVKGHAFPTIVKVRPVGCDPLALVDCFTPVEDSTCLLETRFDEDVVFVFPEDVTGSMNLTLLSLFFGVTATNFSPEFVVLGKFFTVLGSFFDTPRKTADGFKFLQNSYNPADFRKFFWNSLWGDLTRRSGIEEFTEF
ncbi:hypothetical protein Tco_1121229 [Tanacetum coccineum]|uniref:Uncharacterized protein n=1 Tax=Tanacetum coccineum TaxID=301880 RepID=A0ABQ5J0S6_9ASTR